MAYEVLGDGQICHYVPLNWEFPSRVSVKTMWNLWYHGDKEIRIRPYRYIRKQHDIRSVDRMKYVRVKTVMEYTEKTAIDLGLFGGNVREIAHLQIESSDVIFAHAFECVVARVCGSSATKRSLVAPSTTA